MTATDPLPLTLELLEKIDRDFRTEHGEPWSMMQLHPADHSAFLDRHAPGARRGVTAIAFLGVAIVPHPGIPRNIVAVCDHDGRLVRILNLAEE